MAHETRYPRPDQPTLDALVTTALADFGTPPHEPEWVEHGSNTLVALTDRVAVRIARQRQAGGEVLRSQRLVDALPDLPFDVPRSLAAPVEIDGHVAVATRRLLGSPQPTTRPDAGALREVLDAVHGVDAPALEPHLAPRRAFCGGEDWEATLRDRVVPLLAADLHDEALRRIDALAAVEQAPRTVNHGDLGSSNVLWHGDRVGALLDWDLTALEDPAEDVATAATSFGLWPSVEHLATIAIARRARAFAGTFPLQIVAFSVRNRRPTDELRRTLARAHRALQKPALTGGA
ncbi:phosphotransferase family protein [Isoptericola aurantiacus]|uniref:phosphotransferase family protein n=1 Tax=Isoptericola aurantiacus TaxID=3377839 RepID=UPI00383A06A4